MPGLGSQLPDGRLVIAQWSLGEEDHLFGPVVVWDPTTGSTEVIDNCVARESQLVDGGSVDCDGPVFGWFQDYQNTLRVKQNPIVVSADGSYFLAQAHAFGTERTVRAWDAETLEVRAEIEIPHSLAVLAAGPSWVVAAHGSTGDLAIYDIGTGAVIGEIPSGAVPLNPTAIALDHVGSALFVGDVTGRMFAFDTSTWEPILEWEAHNAWIRGVGMSADGSRLATAAEDNLVKVWDIENLSGDQPPLLMDRIPAPKPSDAVWLDSETLAVFPALDARVMVVPLSISALLDEAQRRLTRGFSPGECATYLIDPCPTLEDIRSR